MREATGVDNLTDVYLEIDAREPLSADVIARVNAACDRVEDAPKDVILLVHLRAGQTSAGEPWPHEVGIHAVNQWERALRRLERLPTATLAVVDGYCSGLALEVLLATDYRIAASGARLRVPALPEGTWPGMTLYRMANQLGVAPVRRLALFGVEIGAARAAGLGLVDEVGDDVVALAREALEILGGVPGRELAIRRRLLLDATTTSYEDALGSHLAACDRAVRLAQRGLDAGIGV
jgi:isomerase DpgB